MLICEHSRSSRPVVQLVSGNCQHLLFGMLIIRHCVKTFIGRLQFCQTGMIKSPLQAVFISTTLSTKFDKYSSATVYRQISTVYFQSCIFTSDVGRVAMSTTAVTLQYSCLSFLIGRLDGN